MPEGIPTGVVWTLISIVGTLVSVIGVMAWAKIADTSHRVNINAKRVNELEKVVPVVQTQYTDILRRLVNIENKIDKNGGGR